MTASHHAFEADVPQVLSLVIESLYSNREIFLRELISNASDALDKLRFESIAAPELAPAGRPLEIRLAGDPTARTLVLRDNGIGMTRDELVENLGRIAHSGTRAFLERAREAQAAGDVSLIGQFGVGFYSAFLVADRVDVVSRRAGQDDAWRWSSTTRDGFSLEPAELDGPGTEITLHLKEDQADYANAWTLRSLVRRYSDFVSWPILVGEAPRSDEDDDTTIDADTDAAKEWSWDQANRASALWRRPISDVSEDDYADFFSHLSWMGDKPLARNHFRVEGNQEFYGLLYVPTQAPFDLFRPERKNGVRLYVRRVLILESSDELVPEWLRFLKGVIDSDDLPLNVSRELLQDSRQMRAIRKQIVKKSLEMLEDLAENRPDDYVTFWKAFGRVFKEGVHSEHDQRDRMAKLLRFESSHGEGLFSLASYLERRPEGQDAIYYALAPNRKTLESSPHLERLRRAGREVLYLVDPIDQWVVDALTSFQDVPLVNAATSDIDLGTTDEEKQAHEAASSEVAALVGHLRETLGDRVADVRTSSRLDESPSCLVTPEGGMAAHIERALRASGADVPTQKRILEINPSHPIVRYLHDVFTTNPTNDALGDWIDLLHDQALLAEGSPIDDPASYVKKVNGLLLQAARGTTPTA